MNPLRSKNFRRAAAVCVAFLASASIAADTATPAMSASELAGRLNALRQDGASYIRLRLEVKQPPGTTKSTLQIQIKARNTKAGSEMVYQVLWPKERKGEAVLLRKTAGHAASGSHFVPPDKLRPIEMSDALFGSDLSFEDLVDNPFAWPHQAIVGAEVVDRVSCEILESKPGGQHSSYASVRTWVDTRRLVPMRIEKYLASGQLARRIDTTNVAADDLRRPIPANLAVRGSRKDSVTELDGSRIRHDVTFADREFTPEGLKELAPPQSAAQ